MERENCRLGEESRSLIADLGRGNLELKREEVENSLVDGREDIELVKTSDR